MGLFTKNYHVDGRTKTGKKIRRTGKRIGILVLLAAIVTGIIMALSA